MWFGVCSELQGSFNINVTLISYSTQHNKPSLPPPCIFSLSLCKNTTFTIILSNDVKHYNYDVKVIFYLRLHCIH